MMSRFSHGMTQFFLQHVQPHPQSSPGSGSKALPSPKLRDIQQYVSSLTSLNVSKEEDCVF